ncbi:hypothetical protein [Devosia sp. 2618]|uniref:hypothetical protein n=1 Tax=Devosia sp. 2618 TaxID=3156454 RepID=UPI00339A4017
MALFLSAPATAQDSVVLERAISNALDTFEMAYPKLGLTEMGVEVAAYREALAFQHFQSRHWGGNVSVKTAIRDSATGSCSRFAAFVQLPPDKGAVNLVLCPQFFSPNADALRELTILHEMVHVVAGPNECQAMAFAARIQQVATGQHTRVEPYWKSSGCEGSGFSLPK